MQNRFAPQAKLTLACVLLLALCSCATTPQYTQTGIASWYGPGFHGKTTASGRRYNMNRLTAAHPTLPFGSVVKVKNLENGKSVFVRITDRGPFAKGRIIDLSRKAAKKIDMYKPGTARVVLEVTRWGDGKYHR